MSRIEVQWCRVWVAVLILLSPAPVDGSEAQMSRSVSVSIGRVKSAYRSTKNTVAFPPGASTALYCPSLCIRQGWCNLWCVLPSTECLVSNIIVMANYQETDTSDALTCYTTRPKNLVAYGTITGGAHTSEFPERVIENLADGYFSYDHRELYSSDRNLSEKWFAVDFGRPTTFQHVVMHAMDSEYAPRSFTQVVVRVGNETAEDPPADFVNYELFGTFPGKASPGQVVEMTSPTPTVARFVSVQKVLDDQFVFTVAHLEVY
ncbi:hypothetical protein Pcinc_014989 [Petrolisthes cinctipes]|uniref:F5/8 type C domain-containing protein n=1 Tax=Petrolisthes cinctipes TaxID=88211 RepID=A0AAE1KSP0_PETCI|nr:hypothetical protein Pcinc_014989 [Petrolisthes cinctipes]